MQIQNGRFKWDTFTSQSGLSTLASGSLGSVSTVRMGEECLKVFTASLEDLSFNSKPIIDELTRFAGSYRQFAAQIAQKVEDRILEVRPDWKLPSLYLLDSILKNIKAEYLQIFSKNIVRIFCHCFEKLVEPDSRKALYKLRQTWTQYFPNRKLALIDKHVKALDPNWPVTAVEVDPPSPTIFVNPQIFLKSDKDNGSHSSSKSTSANQISPEKKPSPPKQKKHVEPPSPKKSVSPIKSSGLKKKGPMTIEEKRKQLLEDKKAQRMKQQVAMGLSSEKTAKEMRSGGSSLTPPSSRGSSPLKVPSPRARSTSPHTVAQNTNSIEQKKQENITKEITPPPKKRPKLDTGSQSAGRKSKEAFRDGSGSLKTSDQLLKQSHFDDIPREPLPKHRELILKQIQAQLNSGNLTSEHHSILRKQLEKLYELQELKEVEAAESKPQNKAEQTDQSKHSVPSEDFISLPDTNSNSPFFVDTHGSSSNDNSDFGPKQGNHRNYHDRAPPRELYPRWPRYRGDHRPYRHRPHPIRRPRGGPPGRYFDDGFERPPPRVGPGRGQPPPPPYWQDHPPQGHMPPPPHGPLPPMAVSHLIDKLVDAGMIEPSSKNPELRSTPTTVVPILSLTVATLKQRYSALIDQLHVGKRCGTCGIRFADSASEEYEKHLDWHFKNRNNSQTHTSRNWFIHPEDWLKFEELSEDSEEREPTLKPSGEGQEEEETSAPTGEAVSSCVVLPREANEVCNMCQEPLEQFWEEDLEEWHFKDAIRSQVSGKLYHTFCFQDVKEDDLNASDGSAQQPSPTLTV